MISAYAVSTRVISKLSQYVLKFGACQHSHVKVLGRISFSRLAAILKENTKETTFRSENKSDAKLWVLELSGISELATGSG